MMPSKKERIEYLENEVVGLHNKLSEVIGELDALKNQVGNAWLIPTTNPVNVPSVWGSSNSGYCPICGQYYWGGHYCFVNPIKITVGNSTNGNITVGSKADRNSIVSNGVTYSYFSPKPELKEGV
jgi:hypothetical protein